MSLVRINRSPSRRSLVTFALAWLALVGLLGAQMWHRGSRSPAEIAWMVAAAVPLLGCLSLDLLKAVYVGLSYATYPVGFVVSHVVLALVYYLVLTPVGLVMRLFRYDPLSQRPGPQPESLWIRRVDAKTVESYFRQS